MNYTTLPARRKKERRKKHPIPMPGAMENNRTKDTKKRPMNAAEKRHADRLCAKGCVVCGKAAEYHHETRVNGRRDHRYGTGLCPEHHRTGKESRHTLGLDGFEKRWGIDLVDYAIREWRASQEMERARAA